MMIMNSSCSDLSMPKGGRLPRAQVHKAPQRAGQADDETADGKSGELGIHGTYADHAGGDVHVAHGHPFAANGTAHQVLGEQTEHHHKAQAQQILLRRRVELEARDLQGAHTDRA